MYVNNLLEEHQKLLNAIYTTHLLLELKKASFLDTFSGIKLLVHRHSAFTSVHCFCIVYRYDMGTKERHANIGSYIPNKLRHMITFNPDEKMNKFYDGTISILVALTSNVFELISKASLSHGCDRAATIEHLGVIHKLCYA